MATVSTEGLIAALNYLNTAGYGTWQIRLTKATYTLTSASVLANLTALESTFPGYAAQGLLAPAAAAIDGSGNAIASFGSYTFVTTGTSSELTYGMFVADTALSVLIGYAQFATAIDMTGAGNQCIVALSDFLDPA